jgi:hypothetical protein
VDDVNTICWSAVCNEEQKDIAFLKLLIQVTNEDSKITVKTVKSPWIDEEFKK